MTSIFVAKLDFGVTSDQLRQTFQQFGTVLKATVATDRETGKSRGFGFVEMADRNEAMTAIKELDGFLFNGRPIAVKEAEQRQDTRPPRDSNFQKGDFNRNRENKPSGYQRNENQSGEYKRPSNFQRSEESSGEYKRPAEREFTPPPPSHLLDPSKPDIRKKSDKDKDKKGTKDRDTDSRAKKTKMSAYKKSGKNNRFFEEDDDDWDINSADNFVDDELEEDDSDNWNDEPSDYVDHSYEEEEDEEDED